MSEIAKRIRESRKAFRHTIGDVTLIGTRPSLEQVARYNDSNVSLAQVCRNHVTDWEGVKESDLVEDGEDTAVKFDRDDFGEAISEKSEWWDFATAIIKDTLDRDQKRNESKKKSKSG